MTSSLSTTANGSSPTLSRLTSTAWPRPRGSAWQAVVSSMPAVSSRSPASRADFPRRASTASRAACGAKWSSSIRLPGLFTRTMCVRPAAAASSTPYWMIGLSTMGSSSLGSTAVAGRMRVPSPAAGNTALRIGRGVDIAAHDSSPGPARRNGGSR